MYCDIKSNLPVRSIYWLFTPYGKTEQVAIQTNDSRYTGGTTQEASLTINDVTFDDIGMYKCSAMNEIGVGSGPNMMLSVVTTVQGTYRTLRTWSKYPIHIILKIYSGRETR